MPSSYFFEVDMRAITGAFIALDEFNPDELAANSRTLFGKVIGCALSKGQLSNASFNLRSVAKN